MSRFHITITDTTTDDVIANEDADVIIGAYQQGGATGQLCYAEAEVFKIIACCAGVLNNLRLIEMNNPEIEMMRKLGVVDAMANDNLENTSKHWKQMTVSFPDFKGGCQ